jgi:fluoride exporter
MLGAEVAFFGGLGAVVRYLVDRSISRRFGTRLPWGTMSVNVIGSTAIGFLIGLQLHGHLASSPFLLLATGLLGGFTTASTLAVESVLLAAARGRLIAGVGATLGTAGAALLGGSIGFALGSAF